MTLVNKYLRYSPEITLEIFTLVWDKLIESGFKSKYNNELYSEFICFKDKHNYLIIDDIYFNTCMSLCITNGLEITVQEILGYDPFVNKEVIPEYVECISWFGNSFTPSKIYKVVNGKVKDNDGDHDITDWNHRCFKPSSKSAFDAQNQSKTIEKWSVGSYVVFLKDLVSINTGYIDVIKETLQNDCVYLEKYLTMAIGRERSGEVKWFATKSEAEEFAKTLVEPVKHGNGILDAVDVKQPLKQAVHCKTQKEWDFVTEKLGYKWAQHCSFSAFRESTCISLIDTQYSYVDYLKNDYQILSFQEWCDLNEYKMENEVKFEVGKWYSIKTSYNWIIKFKGLNNDRLEASWCCINKPNKKVEEGGVWDSKPTEIKELSLEEIQQYLPDRHADLIKTSQYFKAGESLNTGIEPDKNGVLKYDIICGSSWSGCTIQNHSKALILKNEIIKPAIEFNYLPEPK